MKCPFLQEVMIAFCKACKVKKMLPKDQLTSQNPCEKDYFSCPIFQEFLAHQKEEEIMEQNIEQKSEVSADAKPCIWMKAGVIAYRMCTNNYDCKNCEFDKAIVGQGGESTESPIIARAIEKLRKMPAAEKKCRYMLTGDFSYKICPNNYECWHCAVDQYIQDTIDSSSLLKKRRAKMAKQLKKVKGFTIREDFYYLPNHLWLRIEDEYAKIGIDDFAARIIGNISSVTFSKDPLIPQGEEYCRLGSSNRMVGLLFPADINIVERNGSIESDPSIVRKDPYNKGWLLKIKVPQNIQNMMKGDQVTAWIEQEFERLHKEFEEGVGITITDGGELAEDIYERLSDEDWRNLIARFLR